MNEAMIREITRKVLAQLQQNALSEEKSVKGAPKDNCLIPVGVSARHVHLCREHVEALFGVGYQLTKLKDLPQPGEFAANEVVTLVGPKLRSLEKVRILGDLRPLTQVEISRTDAHLLGIKPVVKRSGDIKGTPGITIVGPAGSLQLAEGVIVANRHIHMNSDDSLRLGVQNDEEVDVRIISTKPTILGKVQIRVQKNANLFMHIDVDDANSTAFDEHSFVEIVRAKASIR